MVNDWRIHPRWVPALAVLNGAFALVFLWAALAAMREAIWFRALGFAGSAGIALLVSGSFIPALRVRMPAANRPLADRMVFVVCYGMIMLSGLLAVLASHLPQPFSAG